MLAQSSLIAAPGLNRSQSPNLSNSSTPQPQMLLKTHKSNTDQITSTYQFKHSADQLLKNSHSAGLHDLVMEQCGHLESLMNDNALL